MRKIVIANSVISVVVASQGFANLKIETNFPKSNIEERLISTLSSDSQLILYKFLLSDLQSKDPIYHFENLSKVNASFLKGKLVKKEGQYFLLLPKLSYENKIQIESSYEEILLDDLEFLAGGPVSGVTSG